VVRKKRRVQDLSGKPQGASCGTSSKRECQTHTTLPAGRQHSGDLANHIQVGAQAVTRCAQLDSLAQSSGEANGRRSWKDPERHDKMSVQPGKDTWSRQDP